LITKTKLLAALLLGMALAGCDLPRDPEATTDHVRGKTLIVGITTDDEPSDPKERAAIEQLAERLDAQVEYRRGELHQLVRTLEDGGIHLIAGHIPETTPFATETGLSAPVSSVVVDGERVKTVFAVRKGENGFLTEMETAMGGTR
tara:strand:+ start:580 stop:1017 length:438 start_codon:yes stop_codon:yes gene_type:complete